MFSADISLIKGWLVIKTLSSQFVNCFLAVKAGEKQAYVTRRMSNTMANGNGLLYHGFSIINVEVVVLRSLLLLFTRTSNDFKAVRFIAPKLSYQL